MSEELFHTGKIIRAFLVIWMLLVGCIDYSQYEEFFRLDMDEQEEAIKGYSLDDQVEIYLISERWPERPTLALALAENGAKIIPALTGRLTQAQNAWDKIALLNVFRSMEAMGSYSVAADDTLMQMLDREASSISDDSDREFAIRTVDAIRGMDERSESPFIQNLREQFGGSTDASPQIVGGENRSRPRRPGP